MDTGSEPSLRHLRVFDMVARLQMVRKAAEAVNLTQPAATQAIAKVESQVGAVLFERRSSGMYLTSAGDVFALRVRRALTLIEDAVAAFIETSGSNVVSAMAAERITRPQIRALAAIANGRVAAEAARLGITPTSLHRAVRDLEHMLGNPLLSRDGKSLVVNRAGSVLSRQLSQAMRDVDWGLEETRVVGERGGELRVGAMPLAGRLLLAPVLNDLMKYFPQARIQLRTRATVDLMKALRLGEIDFVIGSIPDTFDPEEIDQEPLVRASYVLIARRDHPLAGKTEIDIADLAAYDWVVRGHRATRRTAFDRLFEMMPRVPTANIEASSISTIRELLCGSDRLTLLNQFEYEHEKRLGDLIALPFWPIEPSHWIGVTRRAKWLPTALRLKFLELLRHQAASIAATSAPEQDVPPDTAAKSANDRLDHARVRPAASLRRRSGTLSNKRRPTRYRRHAADC